MTKIAFFSICFLSLAACTHKPAPTPTPAPMVSNETPADKRWPASLKSKKVVQALPQVTSDRTYPVDANKCSCKTTNLKTGAVVSNTCDPEYAMLPDVIWMGRSRDMPKSLVINTGIGGCEFEDGKTKTSWVNEHGLDEVSGIFTPGKKDFLLNGKPVKGAFNNSYDSVYNKVKDQVSCTTGNLFEVEGIKLQASTTTITIQLTGDKTLDMTYHMNLIGADMLSAKQLAKLKQIGADALIDKNQSVPSMEQTITCSAHM